jgi:HEAT repeat protein
MSRLEEYRTALKQLNDWDAYLRAHSGLPGPRGNLELAQAVSELASPTQIETWLSIPAREAPENSPNVFLVFCGVTALGRMPDEWRSTAFGLLRRYASDDRWRVREAAAIALQYVGDANMAVLLREMKDWAKGNWYELRAAGAALAEPRLLKDPAAARGVLKILDGITRKIASARLPQDEGFKVLRQAMGYCWSVAVAALPDAGKPYMEKWLSAPNAAVRWIMRENLKKNRLVKMDLAWVKRCSRMLEKDTR